MSLTKSVYVKTKIAFGMFEQSPPVKIIHDFAFYFSVDGDMSKTFLYRVFELDFPDVEYDPLNRNLGSWYTKNNFLTKKVRKLFGALRKMVDQRSTIFHSV